MPPLQVHGFPKVMGVLTHLDEFDKPSILKKNKKKLKHRFWTEVYDGAKLFYLSGLVHGRYNRYVYAPPHDLASVSTLNVSLSSFTHAICN